MTVNDNAKQKRPRQRRIAYRLFAVFIGLLFALGLGELWVRLSGANDHFQYMPGSEVVLPQGASQELNPHGFVPHGEAAGTKQHGCGRQKLTSQAFGLCGCA